MLSCILKLNGVEKLSRNQQQTIKGRGFFIFDEETCLRCNGEWDVFLCALPMNSPCL